MKYKSIFPSCEGHVKPIFLAALSIAVFSIYSIANGRMPFLNISVTAFTASPSSLKDTIRLPVCLSFGFIDNVAFVTIPNIPSLPIIRSFKSKPALSLINFPPR